MQFRLRRDNLSLERLDGEIIAIDFISGKYGSFVGPSADLLWLIQAEVPRENWWGLVNQAFDPAPAPDLFNADADSFVERVRELGIVETVESAHGVVESLPDDYVRKGWTTPVFAVEDDLVDLLVIDPIHDTSSDGWPQKHAE
jgi:hypothetical protein